MTTPIPFAAIRHRCPHCRKSWAHKATAAKHLELCFADPSRRTCKTCKHDEPETGHGDDFDPGGCGQGLMQGPCCARCGEHPELCNCPFGVSRPVANRLQVLCPAWEAS